MVSDDLTPRVHIFTEPVAQADRKVRDFVFYSSFRRLSRAGSWP